MKFIGKTLDKFLGKLKTDRNTFFTYVLTLLTAYCIIDRVVEMLFMFTAGMSVSYWNPIQYTLALACPAFAFCFACSSKFVKSDEIKISFFYVYCVALYIIGISMAVQWINYIGWFGLLSLPNYELIFSEFSHLIKPAFSAISIYLPLVTFYKLFLWLYKVINDPIFPNNYKDSILDFPGIDISPTPSDSGPYSFETSFCNDKTTGKPVKIIERRRFESTLVVGPSGTGKSALVLEPMIAKDLEKKFFLRETSKEMGYTALKSGIATLDCPYSNDYINQNFSLNMLTPVYGKEKVYKAYMDKMIYSIAPDGTIIYKNLGVTSLTPDFEQTMRIAEVAKNLNIPAHIIDPFDPNSIGLNPFIIQNPALCGLAISLVLRNLFAPENTSAELAYMHDVALQAVQNTVILLKVIFPRLNDGLMPTLEDLLKCFTDFDLIEKMCKILEQDEELSKEYALQIVYFKEHFYQNSEGRKDMKRYLHFVTAQLDVLLRAASIKNIVCNRYNNIDLNKVLANGEIVLISSRANDIGGTAHGGFGKFFLWLFIIAVESRPGNEKTRTPYFLYIDDFDRYSDPCFSDTFTQFRKYKVGTVFAIPNLSTIGGIHSPLMQSLLSNASTKISFGNCTPEDYDWWEKEFGERKEWVINNKYNTSDGAYASDLGNVAWDYKKILRSAKIQGLKFKQIVYKTKDKKGKNVVNFGSVDFLESKYKEPRKVKTYNFDKFNTGIAVEDEKETKKKNKFNPNKITFDDSTHEIDPVQIDTTDSSYFFDNADAISFNLNGNNNNND